MSHPTPRIFYVPIFLEIEADSAEVALTAAEAIREEIESEERHLPIQPVIPGRASGLPKTRLTLPDLRQPPTE